MEEWQKCPDCNGIGRVRCTTCDSIGLPTMYCSNRHLKSDFDEHQKTACKAFELRYNAKIGRHYVATRLIKQGETIVNEAPLISAPFEEILPTCLSCYKVMPRKYVCTDCGWPMCNKRCQREKAHKPECKLTDKNGIIRAIVNYQVKHPFYKYVGYLRCLYTKLREPEKYAILEGLENHPGTVVGGYEETATTAETAEALMTNFKLDTFTKREVEKMCMIWDLKKFRSPDYDKAAIYPTCSFFAHSCLSNAYKTFNNKEHLIIRASVDIPEGNIIYTSYVRQSSGTMQRRAILNMRYYFYCRCERCTDQTELGTHMNSLWCPEDGCNGKVLPPVLTNQPDWMCDCCETKMDFGYVHNLIGNLHERVYHAKSDAANEEFLRDTQNILTKHHYLRVQAKLNMCIEFDRSYMTFGSTEEPAMDAKLRLVREIIGVYDRILPGHNHYRGTIYRCLLNVLVWKCGRLGYYSNKEKARFHAELIGVRNILNAIFSKGTLCKDDNGILDDLDLIRSMINSQYKPHLLKDDVDPMKDTEVKPDPFRKVVEPNNPEVLMRLRDPDRMEE